MLQIGDKMPAFEVLDQDGKTVTSQDLIKTGKKTIVYFYPKDNTSGCTAEACSFRDNYAALTAQGYNVVGVSKDSVRTFIFNEAGTLERIIEKVDTKNAAGQILEQ